MKKAIIIAAPSGAGKGTLAAHLAEVFSIETSISATTRAPRVNNGVLEQDGIEYHFLAPDTFEQSVKEGKFLEWEEVYPGKRYGTLAETVEEIWRRKKGVLFDIEVKGAAALRKAIPVRYPDAEVLSIFIDVPSMEALETRLRGRGKYKEEDIIDRLDRAPMELAQKHLFDAVIMNDNLDQAKKDIVAVAGPFLERNSEAA